MAIKYLAANILTGLSTDTKPTNVPTDSLFIETDTRKMFMFNGTTWPEVVFTTTSQLRDAANILIATLADPNFTLEDGKNIAAGTTTGTKVATSSTQKLGFYGQTPIVRPLAIADTTGIATLGLLETEVNKIKQMLRNLGLLTP